MGTKIRLSAFPLVTGLLMVTSCGDSSEDTTFENVNDLNSALESAGYGCNPMTSLEHGQGETAMCVEGHHVAVWDTDIEPEEIDGDTLAGELQ